VGLADILSWTPNALISIADSRVLINSYFRNILLDFISIADSQFLYLAGTISGCHQRGL
jgi:hypothetical protein